MAAPSGRSVGENVLGITTTRTTTAPAPTYVPPSHQDVGSNVLGLPPPAATAPPAAAKPSSGGGQSISAFFHHLAGDTVATAEGIGPGLYHLATNPVGVTKQLASNEYTTWRPFVSAYTGLFTGDTARYRRESAKFNAIVNAHPLGPYLDLFTAASLGAGRVAALGRLSEPASAAEQTLAASRIAEGMSPEQAAAMAARSRVRQAAILGRTSGNLGTITARAVEGGAPITVRTLPRGAYRAGRMRATDKLLKGGAKIPFTGRTLPGFPAETGVVGEYARAARAVQRSGRLSYLKRLSDPRLAAYQNAIRKLSTPERMALATIARVPLAADLKGWRQILRGEHTEAADRLATALADPKFLSAYNEPSAALMKAHTAALEVVKARESILEGVGAIRPETVAEAPFIATRVARGAEFVPETPARLGKPSVLLQAQRAYVERLQKGYDRASAKATVAAEGQAKAAKGGVAVGTRVVAPGLVAPARGAVRAERLGTALSVAKEKLARMEAAAANRVEPTGLVGGGTPEQIAAEIQAAGRPQPFYLRDQAMTEPILRRLNPGNQPTLGGTTPPRPGADVFRSTGALMRTGLIDLVHDTLTGSYLTAARHEARVATHDEVVRAAAPIAKGADLPHGMRWVRTIRGQQFPYTQTVGGEHVHELDKLFPDEGDHPLTVGAGARDEEIAVDSRGRRLAVNAAFAKNLESEYRNIGRSLRWVLEKPLDVWRALVLNLRIPWLVNNIVGNNLLYALRFAGNGGLRAYIQLIADMRGPLWVRRLFNSDATAKGLTREDMMAVFPEQHRGTFIGTQLPNSLGRARRTVNVLGAGLAPLDRRTEAFLRRAGTNALLRGSPEAKAFYHAMPKQTRSWRAAMLKAAEQPNLRNLTVREVNDALGDYLSLGPAERGAVRRIAPFYGWYREITRIAAHTLIDTPGRALLLSRLATLEDERQRDKRGAFPSFLQGSVALGPGPQGTERILALRSADPFSTVSDLGRAASLAVHPHSVNAAQTLIGLLNPYLAAAGATVYGAQRNNPSSPDYLGPAATYLNKFGLPGSIAAQVAGGLPQVQLAFPPPPSKLYPTRTSLDLLERLLGDIRRNPSLQQAHYYASQGR